MSSSRRSKLSFHMLYFATGDAQKDSGLEIEVMLHTGTSCSIINYQTFWGISHFQHPILVNRSNKLTKTSSSQVILMIGHATVNFNHDPDGKNSFSLTVWITEMKTQILLGTNFYLDQASGIHFHFPGIEARQPANTFCFGSLH